MCGSREKCDRFFFVTPTTTTQEDRSDPYMSPPLKRAGDTKITIWNDYFDDKFSMHHCLSLHLHLQRVSVKPMDTAVQTTVGAIV